MNAERYDVIIVGAGPAGLTAGLYCKRAGLKTAIFEKGLIGGQIAVSKDVDNYPGFEKITGFELAEKIVHHAATFGLNIMNEEIIEIRQGSNSHSVRLANGGEFNSTALILALGGTARRLGVPGESDYFGSGVSYCATCDGFFFRGKVVGVVGGGDNAAEEALHMARLAQKVYVIHRRDALKAQKHLQDRIFSEPKIEVLWNTVVTEIVGEGGSVVSVSCRDVLTGEQRQVALEGVFIRVGFFPNNKLIPSVIRMTDQGFVLTDDKCESSIPGIFVAGDLRQKYANQIIVAAADGCIAALGAAHYIESLKTRGPG